jgi:hypothetical protein
MASRQFHFSNNKMDIKRYLPIILFSIFFFLSCDKDNENGQLIETTKEELFSIVEDFADNEQTIIFRNGVTVALQKDSLFGYSVIIDSLDVNTGEWSGDSHRTLILCDSLFNIKTISVQDALIFVNETNGDNWDITAIDSNLEEHNIIVNSKMANRLPKTTRASGTETSSLNDIINNIGNVMGGANIIENFVDFIKQPTNYNIYSMLLNGISMTDNNEARAAITGDIAAIMSIVKDPKSKLGWFGVGLSAYQTEEAFRKRYLYRLIGNAKIVIDNVETDDKNAAEVSYTITGIDGGTKDKAYYTLCLTHSLQAYSSSSSILEYEIANNLSKKQNYNNLKGGTYEVVGMITPWRYKDNKSEIVRDYFSLYSNHFRFSINPSFLENIHQKSAQYYCSSRAVQFRIEFDYVKNMELTNEKEYGYEGEYKIDYGVYIKDQRTKEYKTFSCKNNQIGEILYEVKKMDFVNLDYNNHRATYEVIVGTYVAETSGPYSGMGYRFYNNIPLTLLYDDEPSIRILYAELAYNEPYDDEEGIYDMQCAIDYDFVMKGTLFVDHVYRTSFNTSWRTQFEDEIEQFHDDGLMSTRQGVVYHSDVQYSNSYFGIVGKHNGEYIMPSNYIKFIGDGFFDIVTLNDASNRSRRYINGKTVPYPVFVK